MIEIEHEVVAEARPAIEPPELARRRRIGNLWLGFLFGLVGPIVCLWMDREIGVGLFSHGAFPLLAFIWTEIVLLVAWLARPAKSPWIAALFSGAFVIGAIFATVVGVVLLPLSLLGMLFLIGFLGLVPFGTAYIFGRLAHDAFDLARIEAVPRRACGVLLGILLVFVPPFAMARSARAMLAVALEQLNRADPQGIDSAAHTLRWIPWFDDDLLVERWQAESDEDLRSRIDELHLRRTGSTVEDALRERAD